MNKINGNLLFILFFYLACSNKEFNFTYFGLNSNGEKILFAEGNLNAKCIPHGNFKLYNNSGYNVSSGSYCRGIKCGDWTYNLIDTTLTINWSNYSVNSIDLAIPTDWDDQLKEDGLYFFHYNNDSIVLEQIFIKFHNIDSMDFKVFSNDYFNSWHSSGNQTVRDHSSHFKNEWSKCDFSIRQFEITESPDKKKFDIVVGLIKPKSDASEVIELNLIRKTGTPGISLLLFSEVWHDLHYEFKPLINYYGLNYSL